MTVYKHFSIYRLNDENRGRIRDINQLFGYVELSKGNCAIVVLFFAWYLHLFKTTHGILQFLSFDWLQAMLSKLIYTMDHK